MPRHDFLYLSANACGDASFLPGLRSRRKNETAPARALEIFLFMNMPPTPAPDFVRLYTFIFSIVLVCHELTGK